MSIEKYMNKYGYKVNIKKTLLYQYVIKHTDILNAKKVSYKLKTLKDLLEAEVLIHSILNEYKLKNIYELFLNENYDLLSYTTYEQKRKMVNVEFEPYIKEMISFNYENHLIFMPHFEVKINDDMLNDYQIFELKNHKEYINHYPISIKNINYIYDYLVYESDFSSLSYIGSIHSHHYYYFNEANMLYVFNSDEKILNEVMPLSMDLTEVKENILKQIAGYYDADDISSLLALLHENNFINDKVYSKIYKKEVKK